jgi:hypothetical protein
LVPVGPLWRCCWPVLPPLVPLISLESLLGGCRHSVSVPSVGIFESNHRHGFFNIMWYTVPTVHNSLGVEVPPYVQSGAPGLMFNGSADCLVTPLTVTCHCKPAVGVRLLLPTQYLVSLQHVHLVPPFLQCHNSQFFQPVLIRPSCQS